MIELMKLESKKKPAILITKQSMHLSKKLIT